VRIERGVEQDRACLPEPGRRRGRSDAVALLRALSSPVAIVTPEGLLLEANDAARSLLDLGDDGDIWRDFPEGKRALSSLAPKRDATLQFELPVATTAEDRASPGARRGVIVHLVRTKLDRRDAVVVELTDVTVRRRSDEYHRDTARRLRRLLGDSIDTIHGALEAKDPYTAAHQRRVADLARAVATELKLEAPRVDLIRTAAMLHDVGKIGIPADILSKQRSLTSAEFALVKTHAQVGHEILHRINFDGPVATIVLQHHERLDGTGYPQGLSGRATLLDSKILAVADVVEAISANRPYRPALGLPAALDEIRDGSGRKYEPCVVDACCRVVASARFAWKGGSL